MTPSERRRRFLAAIRAQARRRGVMIDAGVLAMLGTLSELQERIRQTLAGAPSEFQAYHLPVLLHEVERQIGTWQQRAIGVVDTLIEQAWEAGPAMVEAPLLAAEIQVGRVILPTALMEEVKDFTASKIRDLGPLARRRVEDHIRLGLLGGQTTTEVMRGIGRVVDGPGPLRGISWRAETIARTEAARVHSTASDRWLRGAARKVSGLGKRWRWSGKSRVMHQQVDGQTRAADEDFEMPDGTRMPHPHAAGAPAKHVVNCGCVATPWMATW